MAHLQVTLMKTVKLWSLRHFTVVGEQQKKLQKSVIFTKASRQRFGSFASFVITGQPLPKYTLCMQRWTDHLSGAAKVPSNLVYKVKIRLQKVPFPQGVRRIKEYQCEPSFLLMHNGIRKVKGLDHRAGPAEMEYKRYPINRNDWLT